MDEIDQTRQRVDTLKAYGLLDTPPEPAFDAIVRAAAEQTDAPIAMISLVDDRRQWFKSKLGVDRDQDSIEHSICARAIEHDGTFVVPDARLDPRFRDFPAVAAADGIRFYAGTTLRLANGVAVGTLCVIDRQPREGLDDVERAALEALARRAVAAFEMRREARARGEMDAVDADAAYWRAQAADFLDRAAAALERAGPAAALAHLEQVIALLDAHAVEGAAAGAGGATA